MSYCRMLGFVLAVMLASVGRAQSEFPDEQLPFRSTEAKQVIDSFNRGDIEGGLKDAKRLSQRASETRELDMLIGMAEAELGNYDEALTAFSKGIRGDNDDLPFLIIASRLHATRAELGPGGAHVNGMVRFKPDKRSPEERVAFRNREYVAAADCLAKAIALRPTRVQYQIKRVELLVKGGATESALAVTEAYLKTSPDKPELWLARAQSAVSLGRWTEARSAAQRCLDLRSGVADAYAVLAAAAENAQDAPATQNFRRRAAFYRYVRPGYAVPYSDDWYAAIEGVAGPESEVQESEQKQRRERALATIEGLKRDRSDEASRMLAAICWHHAFHGEIEDGIYAELEGRKVEPLLCALLQDANSYCTIGSCALALARLRSDEGFKLIAAKLPADRNTFAMNIPEALAIYGRPESVPTLAFSLQDAIAMLERNPENFMLAMGTSMFVRRCIWSLARFDHPTATTALEDAAKHREFATDAVAALYVQTRKPEYRVQMLAQLKKAPEDAEWIARRLKGADLPEAAEVQALAEQYNATKSESKSTRG